MRYKQTVIGVAWAVVRPFLTLVICTIVFGRLAGLPSDGAAPYPVLVFAGMLPWFLFSSILGDASNSVVGNANLISKVYFPRIIIPIASAVVNSRRFWDQPRAAIWPYDLVSASRPVGSSCFYRLSFFLPSPPV